MCFEEAELLPVVLVFIYYLLYTFLFLKIPKNLKNSDDRGVERGLLILCVCVCKTH